MIEVYKQVLTTLGSNLHAQNLAGDKIEFTRFQFGNGTYTGTESTETLAAMTSLKSVRDTFSIANVEKQNGATCKLTMVATNLNVTVGYYITEIGIFARKNGGAEILYSIIVTDPNKPEWFPAYNSVAPASIEFRDFISVGNADNVTLSVDAAGLATIRNLEELQDFLEARLDEQAIGLRITRDSLNEVVGFSVNVNLTNTEQYPFNNSKKTVALTNEQERVNTDYKVTVEASSVTGGFLEDVIITDKLVNGFKVEYTGSATSATLKLYVSGGK